MDRIKAIIGKEWAEVFKNRFVLVTTIMLPFVFTALPLGILYSIGLTPSGDSAGGLPPQMLPKGASGLSAREQTQLLIIFQFLPLYILMPAVIPIAIAAASIVGEKTTRSLEALLATPVTTGELLLGKGLAAAIPGLAATWGAFAVFALGTAILASSGVVAQLLSPVWFVAILVVGPLFSVTAVGIALIISSRVNDARMAEQVSMLVVLPVLGLLVGQAVGVLVLNVRVFFVLAGILAVIDAIVVWLAVRLFQRETILTKWK